MSKELTPSISLSQGPGGPGREPGEGSQGRRLGKARPDRTITQPTWENAIPKATPAMIPMLVSMKLVTRS